MDNLTAIIVGAVLMYISERAILWLKQYESLRTQPEE